MPQRRTSQARGGLGAAGAAALAVLWATSCLGQIAPVSLRLDTARSWLEAELPTALLAESSGSDGAMSTAMNWALSEARFSGTSLLKMDLLIPETSEPSGREWRTLLLDTVTPFTRPPELPSIPTTLSVDDRWSLVTGTHEDKYVAVGGELRVSPRLSVGTIFEFGVEGQRAKFDDRRLVLTVKLSW